MQGAMQVRKITNLYWITRFRGDGNSLWSA